MSAPPPRVAAHTPVGAVAVEAARLALHETANKLGHDLLRVLVRPVDVVPTRDDDLEPKTTCFSEWGRCGLLAIGMQAWWEPQKRNVGKKRYRHLERVVVRLDDVLSCCLGSGVWVSWLEDVRLDVTLLTVV